MFTKIVYKKRRPERTFNASKCVGGKGLLDIINASLNSKNPQHHPYKILIVLTYNISQIDELEEKELKLRKITVEQDKTRKMQQLTTEKVQKNATLMKKQLNHERNLKLDAFNRVDELQTTVRGNVFVFCCLLKTCYVTLRVIA